MSTTVDDVLGAASEAVSALLQQQTKNALAFGADGKIIGSQSARSIHELAAALAALRPAPAVVSERQPGT